MTLTQLIYSLAYTQRTLSPPPTPVEMSAPMMIHSLHYNKEMEWMGNENLVLIKDGILFSFKEVKHKITEKWVNLNCTN